MTKAKLNPIVTFIWEKRRLNLGILLGSLVVVLIVLFFVLNKYYTASVSIVPSSASFSSQLGGKLGALAGLAGIGNIGAGGQSQEMYEGIIHSRRLQSQLLKTKFTFQDDDAQRSLTLLDFLEIEGDNQRQIWEKAFKKMNEEVIYTEINPDNNILYIKVTLKNPFLAAAVANKLVEYLENIVRQQINKEYNEQYDYLKGRITVLKDSIQISENNLKNFLKTTRDLNAPENVIKELRLRRILTMQSAILAELRKQEELFVLQNMVNLSPVKVLDHAIVPYKKSRPRRALLLISFIIIIVSLQFLANYAIVAYRAFRKNLGT
ncbi:hypothetical protein ACX8XP_11020 [Calditrichota bacterium LG25]